MLGPLQKTAAYFSEQLDMVARGWLPCLRVAAATCLSIKAAEKLTRSQPMTVWTLHQVSVLLET